MLSSFAVSSSASVCCCHSRFEIHSDDHRVSFRSGITEDILPSVPAGGFQSTTCHFLLIGQILLLIETAFCMISCACARCFRRLSHWPWSDQTYRSEMPNLKSWMNRVVRTESKFADCEKGCGSWSPWSQNWTPLFCSCAQMDKGILDILPAECSQRVLLLWRGSSSPRKPFSWHLRSSKRFGVPELVAAVFSVAGRTNCAIMRLTAWNLGLSLIFSWEIVTCNNFSTLLSESSSSSDFTQRHKAATWAECFSKLENRSFHVNDLWLIVWVAASLTNFLKTTARWYFFNITLGLWQ